MRLPERCLNLNWKGLGEKLMIKSLRSGRQQVMNKIQCKQRLKLSITDNNPAVLKSVGFYSFSHWWEAIRN